MVVAISIVQDLVSVSYGSTPKCEGAGNAQGLLELLRVFADYPVVSTLQTESTNSGVGPFWIKTVNTGVFFSLPAADTDYVTRRPLCLMPEQTQQTTQHESLTQEPVTSLLLPSLSLTQQPHTERWKVLLT